MSAYSSESYNNFIQDLKSIEKTIQSDLKELKINAGTNVNTFNTENSVRKGLDNYLNKVNKARDDYNKNSMDIKYTVPEKEYNRRVNDILELKNNYDRMKGAFDAFIDMKYKYVR
jgi:beta-glucosidase-like glycosyl hydrolase